MRFTFCFLVLVTMSISLYAQQVYTITADSTKLTGCDSNELIIENHTQGVKGFLFNTGKGRTIFQRGAIKINESSYLIGADTLTVGGGITDSSTFYVQKRYTGTARAIIAGYTQASVSSTNSSYVSQLARAVPGNILSCYPDPFSARNAAIDALAAGRIKHAQIVILEGNQYTIGSKDSSKNGSIDGLHANNGTLADIQFDSMALAADRGLSSIMKNGVDMYFSMGTNLTYINSSYAIYCVYLNDSTNNTYFKSNTYGEGTFYQVYGEANGFMSAFYLINDRNAFASFHAREVIMQQFQGFSCQRFSILNIEVEDLLTADANVFGIGISGRYNGPLLGNAANSPEMVHFKIKNWRFGKDQIPYPTSNDVWYSIELAENPWLEGTEVTFDLGNVYMFSTDYQPLFQVETSCAQYGVRMTVNIDNLVQKDCHLAYFGTAGGLLGIYNTGVAVNSKITYNIKSARIEAALLGFMDFSAFPGSKGNQFNINVGELQKDSSAFAGGLFNVTSAAGPADPMVININGNFKSYDNKPMIYVTNWWYSYPFVNRYVFSGTYNMAHSGQPVAHFYTNTGKIMAFKDAILINDGITPSIMADSTCANFSCNCCQNVTPLNIPVYMKNVHANSAPTSNIQLIGDTAKVVADIPDFFKW